MSNKWRDKLVNYHLNSRMVLLAFFVLFGSIFLASGQPTPGWYSYGGVLMDGYHPGVEEQQQDTKSQEI
jgi:heme/copper-type cytochrome/quinol oxidase subunit 1